MADFLKRFHRYRCVGFTVMESLRYAWIVSTAGHRPLITPH